MKLSAAAFAILSLLGSAGVAPAAVRGSIGSAAVEINCGETAEPCTWDFRWGVSRLKSLEEIAPSFDNKREHDNA